MSSGYDIARKNISLPRMCETIEDFDEVENYGKVSRQLTL
jgi:hypothetical protein